MVQVVFDDLGNQVDNSLDFLAGSQGVVFADPEEVDDRLWENDLAYLKVNLLVFQDFYLFDPATDAHVLKDVDRQVYNC